MQPNCNVNVSTFYWHCLPATGHGRRPAPVRITMQWVWSLCQILSHRRLNILAQPVRTTPVDTLRKEVQRRTNSQNSAVAEVKCLLSSEVQEHIFQKMLLDNMGLSSALIVSVTGTRKDMTKGCHVVRVALMAESHVKSLVTNYRKTQVTGFPIRRRMGLTMAGMGGIYEKPQL